LLFSEQNPIFAQWVISLNLVLAGLRLSLKNRQVGEKWVADDCSYLCKGLILIDLNVGRQLFDHINQF
jgi:hypothetical protein